MSAKRNGSIASFEGVCVCKKKKGIVLAVVMFGLAAALVSSAAAAEGEKSPPFPPSVPYNFPADETTGSAVYRMILAVSIVAALGIAAIYAAKKLLPRLTPAQGKKVKVLETVHLGPRKMVHLLEIGGQQILIGSTPDKITKLADIMDVEIEKNFPLGRTRSAGETR